MRTNLIILAFVAFLSLFAAYVAYSYPQDDKDRISQQQLDLQRAAFSQKFKDTVSKFTPVVTVTAHEISTQVSITPAATMSPVQVGIAIRGDKFTPAKITIQKGTTVIWQNEDVSAHTISGDLKSSSNYLTELESSPMRPGDLFFYTFNTPGEFNYIGDAATPDMFYGQIVVVK